MININNILGANFIGKIEYEQIFERTHPLKKEYQTQARTKTNKRKFQCVYKQTTP